MLLRATMTGLAVILAAGLARAQGVPEEDTPAPAVEPDRAENGSDQNSPRPRNRWMNPDFWPRREMIARQIRRMAERVADRYEMDDEQYERLETQLMERWPRFLEDNKREIQGLVGDVIRGRMRGERPGPDEVRQFGDRLMPLFRKLRTNVEAGTTDFRHILRPEQRERFETDFNRARTGMKLAQTAIEDMQDGILDPEGWSQRFRDAGLGPRRRRDRGERGGPAGPTTRNVERRDERDATAPDHELEPSLSDWEKYVAGFIRRHGLDDGQTTSALAILQDLQARRDQYLHSVSDRVTLLERQLDSTEDPQAQADIEKQLTDIDEPLDEMAEELHRRLKALLTAAQLAPEPERPDQGQPAKEPPQTNDQPNERSQRTTAPHGGWPVSSALAVAEVSTVRAKLRDRASGGRTTISEGATGQWARLVPVRLPPLGA